MKMATAALILAVLALSPEAAAAFRARSPGTGPAAEPKAMQLKDVAPKAATPKATAPKDAAPKAVTLKVIAPKDAAPKSAAAPKAVVLKAAAPAAAAPKAAEDPKAITLKLRTAPQPAGVSFGADGPVLVLDAPEEVPVVEVVVTDAGDAEEADGVDARAEGLNASCQREMGAMLRNATLLEHMDACEERTNATGRTVAALQRGDGSAALAEASRAFRACGGLSEACAGEVAGTVVLDLRLSGMLVTDACAEVGRRVGSAMAQEYYKAADASCSKNATQSMVAELERRDLEGAVAAAQQLLQRCQRVAPPCDFQLAPLLLMDLVRDAQAAAAEQQWEEQQQVTQVLLAGLLEAQQLKAQMAAAEAGGITPELGRRVTRVRGAAAKGAKGAKKEAKKEAPKAAAPQKAAAAAPKLSLLSVARHLRRVVSARRPARP